MFLCVSEPTKIFGVWSSNGSQDIDLSTPKCICSTWPGFWVLVIYPWVCQHLQSSLQMFLCVSGTSKKYLVYGDLIEAEILTTPPQGIWSTYPCYLALALCTRVCQHLPSSLVMFPCVSGTSKKYLVHGALIEAEILTSTLPHAFAQFNPILSAGTLPKVVSTPPKRSGNVSIYIRNIQKIFGAWVLNRGGDIDLPAPQYICSIWPGFGW